MIATSLQIVGAVLASIGLGIVWIPLGVIALGTFALLFGIALERVNA